MPSYELIESLGLNAGILEQFVGQIPESKMHLRRGEGFWTVYEHVHHLALVQPLMYKRIRMFKNEIQPVIKPFNPIKDAETEHAVKRPVVELVRTFREWRAKQIELAKACDESDWNKSGTHPEYDAYSLEILLRHVLMHDGFHMYRMEELWLAKDDVLTKL